MTKPKRKQNSSQSPKPVENNSNETQSSSDFERQFEVELCWCIQQLQIALSSGKLSLKQIQDHRKALNVLMSNTTPLVQKRQTMRLSFGDYRTKMAAEEKKLSKVTMQVKLSPAKPSAKSVFVKKSAVASNSNDFKFNFEVSNKEDLMETDLPENKLNETQINNKNFNFLPSDNSFRFSFDVSS
ncbi:hypothetical protein ILUMI_04184 [Ignelater luminosus]|uniref:Uncharacterized protein n=1 Tax=Ignelater luminosus TaxID=2038154 RepID=A0A8K0D9L3_IGNLU|nr:hypothetical protein ILUMI_04184 [Ignelater luminosus]